MSTDAEDIARAVLAKASANDQTFVRPDPIVIAAWAEHMERLTPADALAAVTEHYDRETRRIMPADVRRIATRLANERHDRQRLLEITDRPNPAGQHQAAELVRSIYERQRGIEATPEDTARRHALTVRCPWEACHAAIGEPCKGPGGRPLEKTPAHEARILAATNAADGAA